MSELFESYEKDFLEYVSLLQKKIDDPEKYSFTSKQKRLI